MAAAALQLLWVSATAPQRFYLTLNHLMLNIIFTLLYATGQMFKFNTSFLSTFCLRLTSFLPKISWSATVTKSMALTLLHFVLVDLFSLNYLNNCKLNILFIFLNWLKHW